MHGAAPSEIFQPLEPSDPTAAGNYELVARLGAGGMGRVYLSYTPAGRPVALKVIRPELADDPQFRRRFHQEVAAAQQVHGLYTAPVIDSDTEATAPWLATAFVPGPTLTTAVARHGALPVPSVLLLAAGVAEALQAVHAAHLVHRDLKPSNVLLATDGPRVIDFGIARAADATGLTDTGVAVGTPTFMSPEQALGRELTPAADIFALGQVVAYAGNGTPVYGEGPAHSVLYRIVHEEPDLTGVPEALLPLLRGCLVKEPGDRPSLTDVVDLCRAASENGRLRRSADWLPVAVATDITRHEARLPQPAGDVPATAPAAVPPQPTQVSEQPQGVHQAPTQAGLPRNATPPPPGPPGHPGPGLAPPPGHRMAGGHPPPGGPVGTWPGGGPGVAPSGRPPGKQRNRRILLWAGICLAVLFGLGRCATVLDILGPDGQDDPGTSQGPGGDDGERPDPEPATYRDIQLASNYHLELQDDPLKPRESNLDDLAYIADFTGRYLHPYGEKLVLLNSDEQGSLKTCRTTTRYTDDRLDLDKLSPGSELCLTTEAGHIALVTFRGASSVEDTSQYVTLDVTVWRNAVEPSE